MKLIRRIVGERALWLGLGLLFTGLTAKAQTIDWNGSWDGTWNHDTTFNCTGEPIKFSGNFNFVFSVSNNIVSGSGAQSGIYCYNSLTCELEDLDMASGTVSGTVSGNTITFTLTDMVTNGSCVGTPSSATITGTNFGGVIIGTEPNGTVVRLDGPGIDSTTPPDTDKKLGAPATCGCLGDANPNSNPGSDSNNNSAVVGDPISVGIGNLFDEVTDYQTAGVNPFGFRRYYNSLGDTNTGAVALGHNWRSTFDRYMRFTELNGVVSVVAERADGQELIFNSNGAGWNSDSDVDVQLSQTGAGWTLIDSDDTTETYNSFGQLISIEARNGYTQMLSYNGSNQLVSVSDSFERVMQFTYQSNLLHTVTAPNGLVLTYGYNSSGATPGVLDRLASVTYSTTPQTSQSYVYENMSLPFALTGIIDEDGNRYATWTYDSSGHATSSEHAGGAGLTTITYNADGSRTVVNALGLTEMYKFTTLQGVPKVVEIDRLATASTPAATMTQSYDANGYLNNATDWNTNLAMTVNDIHDQPLNLTEAVGTAQERATTASYAANFHLPLQIVAPRKTTSFTYDGYGNMLTRTETDTTTQTVPYSTAGQTRTWTNTYDGLGHLLTATGPRTDLISIYTNRYDGSNDLITVIDPLGHLTWLTNYNGSGLPLTMIDPNHVTNRFTYDARNRLLTSTVLSASGNATNTFGYDSVGNLTSLTLPNGTRLNYLYDAAHRLTSVTNSLGESIGYTLDAAGDVIQQIIKNNSNTIVKTQTAAFDGLGRMLRQIGASSQTTAYAYDADGNQISIQDGLNNQTERAFDPLNRLISVLDPLNNFASLSYDPQNNLTNVTDPRSLVTSYVYDGFGRVIEEISPDKGATAYALDLAGNRVTELDARGIYTYRTFDAMNRVTSITYPASTAENIACSYDSTNGGNFGVGRLTGFTDESGGTALTYNARGDIIKAIHEVYGHTYTNTYGYDLADNVTNITYPSGAVVSYPRDSQGRISSVMFRPSAAGTATTLATNVAYLPFGPLSGLRYGNGLVRTQSFDEDYRLTNITTSAGATNVQNLQYGYDPVNHIISIADNLASPNNQQFGYDPDYRLIRASGFYGPQTYTYDPDGNRLTRFSANTTETFNYSPTANQLLSTVNGAVTRHFTYTANGNVNTDDRGTSTNLTFEYYSFNRNTFVYAGSNLLLGYGYNAPGERVLKYFPAGGSIAYQYDEHGHLLFESLTNGTVIRQYVWLNDTPLAQIENGGTIYYLHPDHLNRPQKITSSTRTVVWDNEEDPFGEPVANPHVSSFGYNAGKQFQLSVNGLVRYNCVVESATNLNKPVWISVATNNLPFTYTESAALHSSKRYYRVLFVTNSIAATVTNNLRFPGQYYDAEFGFHYNMMRDYDPASGRYMEADPVGLRSGVNLYGYVGGNPVKFFDLTGLISQQEQIRAFQQANPGVTLWPDWADQTYRDPEYDYNRSVDAENSFMNAWNTFWSSRDIQPVVGGAQMCEGMKDVASGSGDIVFGAAVMMVPGGQIPGFLISAYGAYSTYGGFSSIDSGGAKLIIYFPGFSNNH